MRNQLVTAIALALPCCAADKVDDGLRKAINEELYRVEASTPGVYRADNPSQRLDIEFDAHETRLKHPQGSASLRLLGYGYGKHMQAPTQAEPIVDGNRVEYQRGQLTEWYKNESGGLEQGFTLARRPLGAQKGEPLTIALQVDGGLQPTIAPEGDAVLLGLGGRQNVLRYEGLRSWDARGRAIASRMEVRGREVRLLIEDRDAQYPLVVDPFLVQAAKIVAGNGAANDHFAWSVLRDSVSGLVLVGAPGNNSNQGAVYTFSKNSNGYVLQQKLTATDGVVGDQFGWALTQANNGSILIGAPNKQINGNANQGAVYVFTGSNNNTTFTQAGTLTAFDGAAGDQFGYAMAYPGGNPTIGAPGKNSNQGAVYAFGGNPLAVQTELMASDGTAGDRFGTAVAGDLAILEIVVGAPNKQIGSSPNQGAVYVFSPSPSGGPTLAQTETTAPDGAAGDNFGFSVSFTANVSVGAPNKQIGSNLKQGAAYLYAIGGSPKSLTYQQELTASDGAAGDEFGYSVGETLADTSPNGWFFLAGAPFRNASQGAVYLFTAPYVGNNVPTSFTQMQTLVAADAAPGDQFGLSLNPSLKFVGAPGKQVNSNAGQGAVYAFGEPMMMYIYPNNGTALSQTFTVFVTGTSNQNRVIYLQFGGTGLGQEHTCFVVYQQNNNYYYLYNDTNTGATAVQAGSGQTASNSQCTVTGISVNSADVPFAITFAPTFTGTKNIYGFVSATSEMTNPMLLGTWTPAPGPPPPAPSAVSVTPNSGSGLSQTFTVTYTDPNGASDIQVAYLQVGLAGGGAYSCFAIYIQASNFLYLYNDPNTALLGPITPGSNTSVSNSRCSLSGSGGVVTASGNNLTVPFTLTFQPAYNGKKNILGYVQSYTGANSGFRMLGTWTPAAGGTLTAVSVTPMSGSGFGPQTFSALYSDTAGAGDIQAAYLDFGSGIFSANSCIVVYVAGNNTLYLFKDDNSSALGPVTAGSGGSVSNSQCTLSGSGGLASPSGNNLTVPFNLTFPAGFSSAQTVFGLAQSFGGTQSSWANLGTWTP